MSRNSVFRTFGVFVIILGLGSVVGCKKKVETVPPDEPKTAELSVLNVRPNSGRSDQTTNISVAGTGFKSGARVTVGDNVLPDAQVPFADNIRATVPSGITPGVYNLVIKNPDGKEAVLQGGFTINAPAAEGPKPSDCELVSVYFDFDASSLSDRSRSTLQRDVDCLKAKNAGRVQVAGHTDERGSTDYNLALGQRRADEVMRYLSQMGINNVGSISYGEEQPAVMGQDESVWSQNRRAEIRVLE